MTIIVIIILAIMLGIAIFKQQPTEYTYEEVVICSGDTFWKYYNEGYYNDLPYIKALWQFEQDNDMENAQLFSDSTVILRKEVK